MITLKQILDVMTANGAAVPAFNIQVSADSLKKLGTERFVTIVRALDEFYSSTPVCLHLDHALDFKTCHRAAQLGFTSVMIDGTYLTDRRTRSTFEYNMDLTTKVVADMKQLGVSVEGALGFVGNLMSCIGPSSDKETRGPKEPLDTDVFTEVDRLVEFASATGIDALAISIGNTHGANKGEGSGSFDIDRLRSISEALPLMPFVLHGGSLVPKEMVDTINSCGGKVQAFSERSSSQYRSAIVLGVRKINIDTDNRLAMTASLRESLSSRPSEINPEFYITRAVEQVRELCRRRFHDFGCSGTAKHF